MSKTPQKLSTPQKALEYLNKALSIEEKATWLTKIDELEPTVEQIVECTEHAGTFLNACAILSQMGKHKDALQMSNKAIAVLKRIQNSVQKQEAFSNESSKVDINNTNSDIKPVETDTAIKDSSKKAYLRGYYLMIAVAHYNRGVEYEYLNDLNEATNSINEASTIAKLHL